jgi:hypothetical protein
MVKTTSKTERDTDFVERIVGGYHYKTTISDGDETVEGLGRTSEEAESRASDKWKKSDDESDSGCYLTTACVQTVCLPDNCFELETLRSFRNKFLMPEVSGRKAVREYYRIAPEIVQAIGEHNDAQSIWQDVYRDIRHAVSLILSGDFEGAFKHYQQMTLRLREKYLD